MILRDFLEKIGIYHPNDRDTYKIRVVTRFMDDDLDWNIEDVEIVRGPNEILIRLLED